MFEFLTNNSSEIITMLISIFATIMPIPIIVEKIIKNINETNMRLKMQKKNSWR